ncbi:MAG: choice-of-anchor L domain-containing protein, partial [Flavisolibacter sp.]
MKKLGLLLAALFLFPIFSFSQLNINATATANALAQNIAGNGVTVSNAAINCGTGGSGTFTYSGSSLGMTGGILLTTGTATTVPSGGINDMSYTTGNNFSDPDLINIEPSATNDVCILEFDFVPICNTISMTFIFGSEEYPEYECNF